MSTKDFKIRSLLTHQCVLADQPGKISFVALPLISEFAPFAAFSEVPSCGVAVL